MKSLLVTVLIIIMTLPAVMLSQDKTAADTTKLPRIPDSLLSVPLVSHGMMFQGTYKPFRKINKKDIQLINYTGMSDIISALTPFYSQHLGSYSTYNSFYALGANSKSISYGYNGRNISDLDLGSLNPEQFSPEFFENVEIWTGADASILGDNSPSVFINFQEIKYNTEKPFTRLWFGNSGYEFLGADGIFSQNLMPNWNFTFGFRSYSSLGAYENTWSKYWNSRVILRWNPDNKSSISITENFTNQGSGTNGGIDTDSSTNIFDPLTGIPVFRGLDERALRHDLTISATRIFDYSIQNSIALNLYLSSIAWERSSGVDLQFDNADTSNSIYYNSYSYMGAEGRYEINPIEAISLRFGGYAELNLLEKTYYYSDFNGASTAAFAHSTIRFSDNFDLSGGLRLFSKFGNVGLAYGVKQTTKLSEDLRFIADFAYSDRLPYPVEGLNLNGEQHISVSGEIQYEISKDTKLTVGAFMRSIFSPINAKFNNDTTRYNFLDYFNGSNISRLGAYAEFQTNLWDNFTVKIKGLSQLSLDESGSRESDIPVFSAIGRIFYTYSPGKSLMRAGIETGFITDFKGDKFFPLQRTFYPGDYDSGMMITGFNGFLEIKIGSAFVKISYNNLLNQKYFYVAVNPMFRRNLRLTVNWTMSE